MRYSAERYTLLAASIFALTARDLGRVDAVFDRAALVALDPADRIAYADQMRSVVPSGAKTLLLTFDYEQSQMDGPPFAVSPDEVGRLFREGFAVEHLETRDAMEPRFRQRGLSTLTESAFSLTRQ